MPSYMTRVGAAYYYRRVVPDHLRPYFKTESGKQRTEFKLSLGTTDYKEAKRRLIQKALEIDALIIDAERKAAAGISPAAGGQSDDYERLLQQQFERSLEFDRAEAQRAYREEEEDERLIAQLSRPHHELTPEQRVMRRNLDPSLLDPPAEIQARQRKRERQWSEGAVAAAKAFKAGTLGKSYLTLAEVFERYQDVSDPTPASLKKWRTAIESLKDFLGHDDVSKIDREEVLRWRDHLFSQGKSSPTVRNGYIGGMKAVFQVATSEVLISENPFLKIPIRKDKRIVARDDKGLAEGEVQTILSATLSDHSQLSAKHALARRWVPWALAYTGARVNEITQLREMDVFLDVDSGVWAILITPEAGKVKGNRARTVPLHSHLIEQGFHLLGKPGSKTPIFYNRAEDADITQAYAPFNKVGERLAAWVRRLGVHDPDVRPNHGWRHLFKTRTYSAGIPEAASEAIMGHAARKVAQTYGRWTLPALRGEIDKLPRFEVTGSEAGMPLRDSEKAADGEVGLPGGADLPDYDDPLAALPVP